MIQKKSLNFYKIGNLKKAKITAEKKGSIYKVLNFENNEKINIEKEKPENKSDNNELKGENKEQNEQEIKENKQNGEEGKQKEEEKKETRENNS